MTVPELLWQPSPRSAGRTRIAEFARWVGERYGVLAGELDYTMLHHWSTSDLERFWSAVAQFCGVRFHDLPTTVLDRQDDMAKTSWFAGSTLNYAEHALSVVPGREDHDLALISVREDGIEQSVTYGELRSMVAAARAGLLDHGITAGDRVVALAPNCVPTVVMFLAAASIGAVWASCSPDFGPRAVQERFAQLEPSVLLAVDGYTYGGKPYDLRERVEQLRSALPTLRHTVLVPDLDPDARIPGTTAWPDFVARRGTLEFDPVPFDHPLWCLYSSGTTGLPKGIVHSHGGIVVEHLKVLGIQSDLGPGDRFFWFTTTGWMMWNYLMGGLLVGATIVLYDGNPNYPDEDRLWELADRYKISFFGVSAPFIHASMKRDRRPNDKFDFSRMRMLGSTGAPLSPAGFRWVMSSVKPDVQIYSNSGGTDLCTPFVLSAPTVPVWTGEISCAALGCEVEAFDAAGRPVLDEVGELVVTTPMPSMPVMFWNDPDRTRLHEAYFADFPGVWRHGDWVRKTPRGSYIIYGRSDSTLNRGGVRMGTAEFYSVVDDFDEVVDSLVIDVSGAAAESGSLLCFLVLRSDVTLESILPKLTAALRTELSPRHVPDRFFAVPDVPRTLNGKKCEVPVKRILMGTPPDRAVSRSAMQNPESLESFIAVRAEIETRKERKDPS